MIYPRVSVIMDIAGQAVTIFITSNLNGLYLSAHILCVVFCRIFIVYIIILYSLIIMSLTAVWGSSKDSV